MEIHLTSIVVILNIISLDYGIPLIKNSNRYVELFSDIYSCIIFNCIIFRLMFLFYLPTISNIVNVSVITIDVFHLLKQQQSRFIIKYIYGMNLVELFIVMGYYLQNHFGWSMYLFLFPLISNLLSVVFLVTVRLMVK